MCALVKLVPQIDVLISFYFWRILQKKKKTKSLAKGFAFELKIKKKKLIVAKKNQYITFIPKTTYVIDVHGDT